MSICTNRAFASQVIGDPCDDCGHTNLVHPGRHNPALAGCVLCQLSDHEATLRVRAAADVMLAPGFQPSWRDVLDGPEAE